MRLGLKEFLERFAHRSGLARLGRQRTRGKLLVLAYHNVVPDGAPAVGDRPNHITLSDFSAQLRLLRQTVNIVPLTEALNEGPEQRAVITFDDAYRGAVRLGIQEIRHQGVSATIFVAPSLLDGKPFWWDALSGSRGLDPATRAIALERFRGDRKLILNWQSGDEPIVDSAFLPATESELAIAAETSGVSIGAHSWSHPNLIRLNDEELRHEMRLPLIWLRQRFRSAIPWLSYPYGSYDNRVMKAAEEAGYDAALGITGGWTKVTPGSRFSVSRLSIPRGLSIDGFGMRLHGWLNR